MVFFMYICLGYFNFTTIKVLCIGLEPSVICVANSTSIQNPWNLLHCHFISWNIALSDLNLFLWRVMYRENSFLEKIRSKRKFNVQIEAMKWENLMYTLRPWNVKVHKIKEMMVEKISMLIESPPQNLRNLLHRHFFHFVNLGIKCTINSFMSWTLALSGASIHFSKRQCKEEICSKRKFNFVQIEAT